MPKPVSARANTKMTLAAPVANAATITVAYPAGFTQAMLTGSTGGQLALKSGETFTQADGKITIAFGASNITVTNATGGALPAGDIYLSFGSVDIDGSYNLTWPKQIQDKVLALP